MRRVSRLAWLFAVSFFVSACGPRALRSPLEPMERGAEAVRDGSRDADALAFAAWHAWLVRGDAEEAERLVASAREEGPTPWSHFLDAELGARAGDVRREAEALVALVEDGGPLGVAAARRLAQLGGVSTELDAWLAARIPALLEEVTGEAALDLRGLWVGIEARRDPARARGLAAEAGRLPAFRVVGPTSAHPFLEFGLDRPALERGPIDGEPGRILSTPLGKLSLADLPRDGDLFYALAVVQTPRRDRFLLRIRGERGTSFVAFLDGVRVLDRSGFGRTDAIERVAEVDLAAGEHLLAIRILRGHGRGRLTVELAPADGRPASALFRPAGAGDRAATGGVRGLRAAADARVVATRLAPEAGILAAWVGAAHALGNDPEAARGFLDALAKELGETPALRARRAQFWLQDPGLPSSVARERAAADLRLALADEGDVASRVALAALHRREGRFDEAKEALAGGPAALELEIEAARLARDRGHDALFRSRARALAERAPDRCAVLDLAWSAAQRGRDEAARRRLLDAIGLCPGGWRKRLDAARAAGDAPAAREIAARRALLEPDGIDLGMLRAEIEMAAGAPARAAEIVAALETLWPEEAALPRTRSRYLQAAGDAEGAREARLRALELDGSDLGLLRLEAFERRKEILAEHDPDTWEAIRAFEASGARHDAPGVLLVDFVGIQVNPDGSQIERTHVLAKILDKRGIELLGEVRLPGDADVLELRTIKADGRVLEPETIHGKDSVSLPGLEVGDYVEYQYLLARSPRHPALPGWAAPRFYFASRDLPMVESLFVVRAPKALGLEVDAHHGPPPGAVVEDGDHLLFVARGRDLPAWVAEPRSVSMQEAAPWIQVGSGAGERALACHLADRLLGASRIDGAVERWVREAVAGAPPRERIARIWARLMEEIEGHGPFETPAPHVLARKRGNRAVLLKAALDVLGIENAWVALGTFERDPQPQRFANADRFPKLVLVARPDPAGGWLWLDPSVRHAPMGAVSPEARGLPGYVLGKGTGEAACVPTTSPRGAQDRRALHYRLELAADGAIAGTVRERFVGFEAASARQLLERLDANRLRQLIEASLAREFSGAEFVDVRMDVGEDEVSLTYAFRLEDGLREVGGERLRLDLEFLRLHLGPRYLTGAERKSPLLLARDERLTLEAEIVLGPGLAIEAAPSAGYEPSRFGSFRRSVGSKDETLVVRDELELPRGRILPHDYPEFAAWVGTVDASQLEDLVLVRSGQKPQRDLGVEIEPEVGAGDPAAPADE